MGSFCKDTTTRTRAAEFRRKYSIAKREFRLSVDLYGDIEKKMAYSGYVWSEPPSMTAMKYQRQGFVEKKPLLVGERFSITREMDRDLHVARSAAENQQRVRESSSMDRTPATSYYKSVVGTRSSKGAGGIFYSEQVGRIGTFSSSRRV